MYHPAVSSKHCIIKQLLDSGLVIPGIIRVLATWLFRISENPHPIHCNCLIIIILLLTVYHENSMVLCFLINYLSKKIIGWVWSSGWTLSWIGLLLLTVTDVSTTCAVVIVRVKVSCIMSVDGIILWLLISSKALIVVCRIRYTCRRVPVSRAGLVTENKQYWIVANCYQRCTRDLLTRSSKANYERTSGELTIHSR